MARGSALVNNVITGPTHKQGGVPFTVDGVPGFEAEGGERIISKVGTSKLDKLTSRLSSLKAKYKKSKKGTLGFATRKKLKAKIAALNKQIAGLYEKEKGKGDRNTKRQAKDGLLSEPYMEGKVTNADALKSFEELAKLYNVPVADALEKENPSFFESIGGEAGLADLAMYKYGMKGAAQPLPTFRFSRAGGISNYLNELQRGAETGLDPETRALFITGAERTYGLAQQAIRQGGFSAAQQAGLGQANAAELYRQKAKLAVLNDSAKTEKQALLGDALHNQYVREKENFILEYEAMEKTKEAAAQLARDSMTNFIERQQFLKAYGPGSALYNYQVSLADRNQYQSELLQTIMENPVLSLQNTEETEETADDKKEGQ